MRNVPVLARKTPYAMTDPMHDIVTATCGAKKRNGEPCPMPPVKGRTRCRMHGGASPVGIDHPSFKGGKYSKGLPVKMLQAYTDSGDDRELVGLREELRLLDVRLQELVARLGTEPDKPSQAHIRATLEALQAVDPRVDHPAYLAALAMHAGALEHAQAGNGVWLDIQACMKLRRQLVDSEAKRLQRLHQMIEAKKVVSLLAAVVNIIQTEVTDPATLRRIHGSLQRLYDQHANRNT